MKKILKYIAIAVITNLIFNVSAVSAQSAGSSFIQAYGIDTIAGYSASIQSTKTIPNTMVTFVVEKPDSTQIRMPVIANQNGIAETDLYDYHTKRAGAYKVWVESTAGSKSTVNTFTVFADEVSGDISTITPSKLVAAPNGLDKIYVTINLKDKHNNPIEGHTVELISSRYEDNVQRISEKVYTGSDGSMIFALSSIKKGVSVYSIIDTTSNIILNKRLEIAFTSLSNIGGDIPTVYAQAGEIAKLEFENIPTNILPNSDISFTLTAVDSEGTTVPNFTGQVHFSVVGSNSVYASVPNDYTFDIDLDAGSHNFTGANSMNFIEAGTYSIEATDLNSPGYSIKGTTDIFVGTSSTIPPDDGGTPDTGTPTADLMIASPTSGTYSNNQVAVTGNSVDTSLTIQVFDNDQNIGSTNVQADGSFSYQPSIWIDGDHTIFTVGLDSGGTIQQTSESVTFTIDTSAPVVEDITFTPSEGIKTGDIINIVVVSEPNVFQGAVVFDADIAELEQDSIDPTKYKASIQAPAAEGTYPVDVILVDELANQESYEGVALIEISAEGTGLINGSGDNGQPIDPVDPVDPIEPPDSVQPPTDVFGVSATSSDSKITLSWQPATDDTGIDHYRIYYGLTPGNLNQVVDIFDARTTWYIPELRNGNEYFFSVAAIDSDDNESINKSSIVSSIPFSLAPAVFVPPDGQPKQTVIPKATDIPKMEPYGPEVLWFLLASFFFAQLYFKFRKSTTKL